MIQLISKILSVHTIPNDSPTSSTPKAQFDFAIRFTLCSCSQGVRKRVERSNGLAGKLLAGRGYSHAMANVKLFSHIVVHLLRPHDDQTRDELSTFDMLATLLDSVRTFFHPSNIGTSVFQRMRE